jgi:hypothetical protein
MEGVEMAERMLFLWFIDRLPVFDPAWSSEMCRQWLDCFEHLWRWGCRLTVLDAIGRYE